MHVAVIGAGVVGCSIARELALQGTEVTIFEQRWPGYGTSGTSFAWVNSHRKTPESYHRLNVAGSLEHRRLAEQPAGGPQWYFRTGNLEWTDDADMPGLDERVRRLDALGYPCTWLDPHDVERLEPDLRLPPGTSRIALFPEEGYVLPAVLLARLLGEARSSGAELVCPTKVTGIEPGPSSMDLFLENGERAAFDRVVTSVGRWTQQLTATCGTYVPLADPTEVGGPATGFLAYTRPVPARLSRVVTTPTIKMRPDGGGRLVLQHLALDAHADPSDPPDPASPLAATLIDRLADVLTLGGFATVETMRVGQRALPVDGHPVAGYTDDLDRLYVVATHSGITLGPLLGRLAAREILRDTASPLLEDYRPGRFLDGQREVTASPARRPGEQ